MRTTIPKHEEEHPRAITPADLLDQTPKLCHCPCGKTFLAPAWLAAVTKFCDDCADRLLAEDEQRRAQRAQREEAAERWQRLCPADYRATDPAKLPLPHLLERVMAWSYGPKGLTLYGPTGMGKSRCAWLLLRREFDAHRRVGVLDHSAGLEYARRFAESPESVLAWIDRLKSVDILFLDDIFKAKLTDSFEGMVFTTVASRCEEGRPVILTTNDTGPSLAARMSQDRGDALLRRLIERTTAIPFV